MMRLDPELLFAGMLVLLLAVIVVALAMGETKSAPPLNPVVIYIVTPEEFDAMGLELLRSGSKPIIKNIRRKP